MPWPNLRWFTLVIYTGKRKVLDVKYSQILVLVTASLLLLGGGASYVTDGGASPDTQCTDEVDNDDDGKTDGDDPGCVAPYYDDKSEFDIWDTDLTALIVGGEGNFGDLQTDFSVFYEGEIRKGGEVIGDEWESSSDQLNETHINDAYRYLKPGWPSSIGENYGGGRLDYHEYDRSEFPDGTVYTANSYQDRVIDPPTPAESGDVVGGEPVTCGDGKENEDIDNQNLQDYPDGQESEEDTDSSNIPEINCKYDYGRLFEKHDRQIPEGQGSMSCNNDETTLDPECDSSDSCGSGFDSCNSNVDENKDYQNDNEYYEIRNQDQIWREDCSESHAEGPVQEASGSCSTTESYACDYECSGEGEDRSCGYTDTCYRCGEPDDYDCEVGDTRDWDDNRVVDCDESYSVVDGGSDTNERDVDGNSIEGYSDKPDNDPAGTYTRFTAHDSSSWGSKEFDAQSGTKEEEGSVWCGYDHTLTVDADGPKGYGDGWAVIHDGEVVGTEGPSGEDTVGRYYADRSDGGTGFRHLSDSQLTSRLNEDCGSDTTCLVYVDMQTVEGSGTRGDPEWDNPQDAITIEKKIAYVTDSYSVCKKVNSIWENNEVSVQTGERLIECDTDRDDTGSGTGTPSDYHGPGGDEENTYWVYMEGPEINEDQFEENPGHFQGEVDNINDCILKRNEVSEGYVGNVAPNRSTDPYEEGGNSPDWEVCLNIDDSVGQPDYDQPWNLEGDEYCMDDQGVINNEAYENGNCDTSHPDYKDAGGEWYDLDSELAQEYLRGPGNDLITNGDESSPHNIAYYWHDNMNPPQHSEHNPEGDRSGTAMEDNCGNPRFDEINCDDSAENTVVKPSRGSGQTFYSFFQEGLREEDYNPQGDSDGENKLEGFTGYANQLQERSDQLEDGMEPQFYDPNDQPFYENSVGGADADAWAITKSLTWSIDTTGVPYPPYSTYYRHESDQRGSTDADSVDKRKKAFANSFAAVAKSGFKAADEHQGVAVEAGDGVWIDPDDMVNNAGDVKLTPSDGSWQAALSSSDVTGTNVGFKMDLTGPDTGLGIDVSSPECLSTKDGGCRVVAEDFYWEQDSSGNLAEEFEQPICGDDRLEYFVEQIGESENSQRYRGDYACADSLNSCYDPSAPEGERLVDQGNYANTEEPGEDVGRFKEDREFCQKIDGQDDFAIWYDQDYQSEFCNQNNLYGDEGVRWFDTDYVDTYPQAVKGGIDDSWNEHMIQRGHGSYESTPGSSSPGTTPVPTGNQFDRTATKGFCGGDDGSEYLATQECNTRYCDTDRTVQGVGKLDGSCVFRGDDESKYQTDVEERTVFEPGDKIEIQDVTGQPEISCFNGAWFSDWPVHFNQDQLDVPLGQSRTVSFEVINVRGTEQTFDVTMEQDSSDPSADQFASFVEKEGQEFRTTIGPQSSRTYNIEVRGGNLNLNNDALTVRADAVNSNLLGSDSVQVSVVEDAGGTGSVGNQEVPGIQAFQIVALFVTATAVFALHGRS
ncbi:MAG: hypothetical protein ACI9LV_000177 [Candidatus Nanohaloarchaea archaeon]|jgi:hypothetical protein